MSMTVHKRRDSQERQSLRSSAEENDEEYLERLTKEVFVPYGCCPKRTAVTLKDKIFRIRIDSDETLKGKKLVHYLAIHNRSEDIERVMEMEREEHDFNELCSHDHPPLFLAIACGCKDAVNSILKYPKIEESLRFVSSKHSWSVLHRSVLGKFDGITDALLKTCSSLGILKDIIDLKDSKGRTALHIAAKSNQVSIVRSLLTNGADHQIKDSKGRTPLMVAPRRKCSNISYQVLMNAESVAKSSNLLSYIENGKYEEAKSLIDKECDLDIEDSYGNGPFLCVIKSRFKEKKKLKLIKLIRKSEGDDINRANANHETVLILSVKKGCNSILEEITNKMLDESRNVELNKSDINENTALHHAVQKKNDFAIERLVGIGADLDSKNKNGDSPLHLAVKLGYIFAVKTLLENGTDVNIQNNSKSTPLHLSRDSEITDLLVEHSPDLTLKDNSGLTPIERAVRRESSDQNATKILASSPEFHPSEAAALSGNSEVSGYCNKQEMEVKITPADILPISEKKSDTGKFGKDLKKQIRSHKQKVIKKKAKEIVDTADNVGSQAIQGGETVAKKVIDIATEGATEVLDSGKSGALEIVNAVKDGAVDAANFGIDTALDIVKTSVAASKPATVAGSLLSDVLEKGKELAKKDIDNWGKNKEFGSTSSSNDEETETENEKI